MWGCSGVSAMTEQLREGSGVLVGLLCTTCTTACCRRALCVKEGVFRGGGSLCTSCYTVCHHRAVCVKEGVFSGIRLCERGGI